MVLPAPQDVRTIGLAGLGTVGTGWAAIYLARGFRVVASDPSPQAADKARDFIAQAWPALRALNLTKAPTCPIDQFTVTATLREAVCDADLIHENAPEHVAVKRELLAQIEAECPAHAIIASSSGGIPPSALQGEMRRPERFLIVHPFNPPHLIPLVEILGGGRTSPQTVDWAMRFMAHIGKRPIRLDKEKTAFLTNRLQFALLREAINCLAEGVASAQSIEDAVRYGLAPRWAAMGSLTTLTLAGGEGGMQRVLDSFSGAIESWWDDLGTPRLTPDVKAKLLDAASELTKGRNLPDLIAWRDNKLVEILQTSATDDPHH